MPLLFLSLAVQVALIVHVLKTGRAFYWVFIIALFPGIGTIAYVIVELLPEWSSSFRARRAVAGIRRTLDPEAELRKHERELKLSGSVEAARRVAGELVEQGRYDEAIEHYRAALTGLYENDPDLLLGLAEAQFGKGEHEAALDTLETLLDTDAGHRTPVAQLLYARALEECGELEEAAEEYEAVVASFAGAEARTRYARLLERLGRADAARAQYEEILAASELAPRHYRKAQAPWIREARDGLARLS